MDKIIIRRWCPFVETKQDFADVCLIGSKAFNGEASGDDPDENLDNEYYSWYKLSCISKIDGKRKVVYRRIRSIGFDGYPSDCMVIDPYTAKELGLTRATPRTFDPERRNKEVTHFRNTAITIADKKKRRDDKDTAKDFAEGHGGFRKYKITTVPVYIDDEITMEKINKWNLRALYGRTVKHPDYALRAATVIALFGLAFSIISLFISLFR